MKKLLYVFLAMTMAFAMVACSNGSTDSGTTPPAQWTITLNANGWTGTGTSALPASPVKVNKGSAWTLPTIADTATQLFQGWSTGTGNGSGGGGTLITTATYTPTADVTLNVRWEAKVEEGQPVTITYNANGWSGTDVPSVPGTGTSGTALAGSQLPTLTDTKTQHFLGWATTSAGDVITVDGANDYTPVSNITLFVRWEAIPHATVIINVNGGTYGGDQDDLTVILSEDETFAYSYLEGIEADLTNPGFDFTGWYIGSDKLLSTYTLSYVANATTTITAGWLAAIDPADYVLTVALGNGGQAAFQFNLPPGGRFDDYSAISYTVKLLNPELLSLHGEASYSAFGNQQVSNTRLRGPFPREAFSDADEGGTLRGVWANLNNWNVPFHAGYGPTKIEDFPAANPDGTYTIQYQLNGGANAGGGTPDAANQPIGKTYGVAGNVPAGIAAQFIAAHPEYDGKSVWPAADATGPFYFGLGVAGQNGTVILQELSSIKLVPHPDAEGVEPVYSTGSGFEKPAFIGYVNGGPLVEGYTTFDGDSWGDNGDQVKKLEAPVYVVFHTNSVDEDEELVVGGSIKWTKPGSAITPPSAPNNPGFIFQGWFTAAAGGSEASFTAINANTQVYAQWVVDEDYEETPAWDELTVEYVIAEGWQFENGGTHNNQRGFATKGAQNSVSDADVPIASNLELVDLQNAIYLVIDVANLPNGGGTMFWQTGSSWDESNSVSVFNNDGAITTNGVQFVTTGGGQKKIIIDLALAQGGFALADQDGYVRIAFGYWGGGDSANLALLGVTNAYLLFDDDYTVVSDPWDD